MSSHPRAHRGYVVAATAFAVAALALAPVSATAQDQGRAFGTLSNRLDRLQRDVEVLQEQVYRGRPPPPGAAQPTAGISESAKYRADLEVRLGQLENQIATVNGRNEELAHSIAELRQRLDKLQSDIDLRLSALERAQGIAPGGAAGQPSAGLAPAPGAAAAPPGPAAPPAQAGGNGIGRPGPGAPPRPLGTLPQNAVPQGAPPPQPESQVASLPPGPPDKQYDYAIDLLLKQQDYGKAEAAFEAFIAAHPKDKLAGNAQYWLGRIHFARGDFQKAAFAFAEAIEKYPKSAKAPDSLLDLGMSLARLGKTAQACTAFARLKENFPKASETVKRRAVAEQQRLKCKA